MLGNRQICPYLLGILLQFIAIQDPVVLHVPHKTPSMGSLSQDIYKPSIDFDNTQYQTNNFANFTTDYLGKIRFLLAEFYILFTIRETKLVLFQVCFLQHRGHCIGLETLCSQFYLFAIFNQNLLSWIHYL